MQLAGVNPEMDPAHPQPIGAHRSGGGQQRFSDGIIGVGGFVFQLGHDRGQAGQLERMVGGQVIGGVRQRRRIAQIGRPQTLGLQGGIARGSAQPVGNVGRSFGQRVSITCEPLCLFLQPVTQ